MKIPSFSVCCHAERLAVATTVLLGLFVATANAQTWTSQSIYVGGNWSDGTLWSGGAAPANDGTANVVFSQSNSTNIAFLDANWSVASVYFNPTPGLGVGQNSTPSIGNPFNSSTVTSLTVQAGGITNASTYPITINPSLVLAQPQTWNVGTNALTVGSVSGPGNLTKTGSGKLILSGTQNAFTGNLGITAGAVFVRDGAGSLGADNATVSLGGGGTLSFSIGGNGTTAYSTALNHPLTLGTGGGTVTILGGYATFTAPISGPGALTLAPDTASNTTASSGYNFATANTYSGGTIIGGGVTATVTGTQQALGTGNVTVNSGGALVLAAMSNLTNSGGVILQDGANNLAPAALVLTDPSLAPASLVSSASTGGVVAIGNLNWTTVLDFSKIGSGKQALGAGGASSVYGAPALYPGSDGVYRLGGGAVGGTLILNGADNVLSGAYPLVVNQNPGYVSSFVATGSASNGVALARANRFTGGTTLYGGSLTVGNDGALGTGPVSFQGGSFGSGSGARTIPNPVVLKNVSVNTPDNLTFSGPVDLGGGTGTVNVTNLPSGSSVNFPNVISNGALALISGTFTLGGANTFAGGLTLSGGRLFVSSDSNLGASGATFNFAGGYLSPTGSTLTINRPVNVTYNYAAIATGGSAVTLNGPVTTTNSGVVLTKRDAGTLILTNPSNTVSINVIGGTLQVDNVPAAGKTANGVPVTVNYGGTLAGTGFVGTTFVGSGHLAPGDQGPGTLTVSSQLSFGDGAILDFDLGTKAADKIVLSDAHYFQFQGSKNVVVVNLADAGGLAPGQTYDLINYGSASTEGITPALFQLGSSPVNGTFALANAGVLQFTTSAYTPFQQWQSTYFGSINNAAAAPGANPAGDGITNLLKYALGLDPTRAEVSPALEDTSTGYLRLTAPKNPNATDVTYNVEVTGDLTDPTSWTTSGTTVVTNTSSQLVVQDNAPVKGTAKRFLRLRVSR